MSAERDALAELLQDNITDSLPSDLTKDELRAQVGTAVDVLLAAGYRKPRTITTTEELDALPLGAVIILRDSKGDPHPAQKGEHGWRLPFVDGFWTAEKLLAGSETAEVIA
ncbi:hypothetical protein ACIPY0_13380 [Paenarthrobacter nicotinovorans]|uniref:hypothetical protein n=1 Tax=Paenarthrobacter nicotinovorans TaxID=29320 RepID=UPI00381EC725